MSMTNGKHLGDDLELVNAARKGDEEAFAALYERHAPIGWRLGLAITGQADAAATTLTDGFARTFTAMRSRQDAAGLAFRSQMLIAMRNTAIDARRHRRPDGSEAFSYVDEEAAPIAAAFGAVPERWRSTLWLHEVEGLRFNQIGPVVGLTSSATTALAGRARNGLMEQYLTTHLSTGLSGAASRTCGRSLARMGSYVAGTLPASDVEKLERHLRLCPDCADRHGQLADVVRRLRLLILPLPDDLQDGARAAWVTAVATSGRTGTGLSTATEKVLAGVSAVAAAVGVFGATMFDTGGGSDDRRQAAASPAAESTETTEPVEDPSANVTSVDLPTPDITDSNRGRSFGSVRNLSTTGSTDRAGSTGALSRPTSEEPSVVGVSNPVGTATPAPGIEPQAKDPGPGPSGTDSPDTSGDDAAPPAAKVGINVGDLPVAIEAGQQPGVTVGPVSVGSQPQVGSDEPIVTLDGPLAPLAPIVDPVITPVDDALTDLTGALGL